MKEDVITLINANPEWSIYMKDISYFTKNNISLIL